MNEPLDVEARLRDALHETAATVEPSPDAWARVVERKPSRAPRRRSWYVVPVAAAIAAIVVAVVLATRSSGSDRVHVTGPTGVPFVLVPESLPKGFRAFPRGGPDPATAGMVCTEGVYRGGRLDCRTVAGATTWSVFKSPPDSESAMLVATFVNDGAAADPLLPGLAPVDTVIVRGRRATVLRGRLALSQPDTRRAAALRWSEAAGVEVVIETLDGPQAVETMRAVAEGLVARPVTTRMLPLAVATLATSEQATVAAGPWLDGFPCLSVMGAPCRYLPPGPHGMVAVVDDVPTDGRHALYGAVPSEASRVRIDLGGRTMSVETHAGPPGGRYFGLALPGGAHPRSVTAVAGDGRDLETVTPLDATATRESPDAGTGDVVGSVVGSDGTRWTLRASWEQDTLCLGAESPAGGSSTCGPAMAVPLGGVGADEKLVTGWVSPDVAVLRFSAAGRTSTVRPMRAPGFPVGFFAWSPATGGKLGVAALDAHGRVVESIDDLSSSSSLGSSGESSSSSKSAVTVTTVPAR